MPLQATSGAASYDAFGGGVAVVPAYIEDVFSCFLYTGTAASLTITNNIDLSTKGGLTWIKGRSGATGHRLTDTARGVTKSLESNSTAAEVTESTGLTAFGTTGFTIGADADYNTSAATYTSWTFRKQPKFFDIVTYSGTAGGTKTISHNLGSVPGCLIVKSTTRSGDRWFVWHRSIPTQQLILNTTAAQDSGASVFGDGTNVIPPTSTQFTVGNNSEVNDTGQSYVAYLFAHDAGGFGLSGTDNVISCGGFTANGNNTITLGYEPQWVMVRRVSSAGNDWEIYDTMRGMALTSSLVINANTSGAEGVGGTIYPTATGFYISSFGSGDIIYIAIRRGPMKVPTTGSSVFAPVARTGTGSIVNITTPNFAPDFFISRDRGSSAAKFSFNDKLRGPSKSVYSSDTAAEVTTTGLTSFNNLGYTAPADGLSYNEDGDTMITECFQRAPSFFDVVCYTGTGSATTFSHNLQAVPELMIVKIRNAAGEDWYVYAGSQGNTKYLSLNLTDSIVSGSAYWNSTTPTLSVFSLGSSASVNGSGYTYVAYLFATCAGVSKVGSYTGTGTTLQIDCGFTAGARFVLIKRTDSTGAWYVWDTARGIVAGNDSYLLLNSTAAEVTSTDYIDTYSAGFEISSTAPAAINANGGSFIFFAVA
jgi:hypothetical protein